MKNRIFVTNKLKRLLAIVFADQERHPFYPLPSPTPGDAIYIFI